MFVRSIENNVYGGRHVRNLTSPTTFLTSKTKIGVLTSKGIGMQRWLNDILQR